MNKSHSSLHHHLASLGELLNSMEDGVSSFKQRPYSTRLAGGISQIRSTVVSEFSVISSMWTTILYERDFSPSTTSALQPSAASAPSHLCHQAEDIKFKHLRNTIKNHISQFQYLSEICDPLLRNHGMSITNLDLDFLWPSSSSSTSTPSPSTSSLSSSWFVVSDAASEQTYRLKSMDKEVYAEVMSSHKEAEYAFWDSQLQTLNQLAGELGIDKSMSVRQRQRSETLKENTMMEEKLQAQQTGCETTMLVPYTPQSSRTLSKLYVFGVVGGTAGMLVAGPLGAVAGLKSCATVKVALGAVSLVMTAISVAGIATQNIMASFSGLGSLWWRSNPSGTNNLNPDTCGTSVSAQISRDVSHVPNVKITRDHTATCPASDSVTDSMQNPLKDMNKPTQPCNTLHDILTCTVHAH